MSSVIVIGIFIEPMSSVIVIGISIEPSSSLFNKGKSIFTPLNFKKLSQKVLSF